MSLKDSFTLTPVVERQFTYNLVGPIANTDGSWTFPFMGRPGMIVLDPMLSDLARIKLPIQSLYRLSITFDQTQRLIAVSLSDKVQIFNQKGRLLHTFVHYPWQSHTGGDCIFDGENRFWYVEPTTRSSIYLITIIDVTSGKIIAQQRIEKDDGYFEFSTTPHKEKILISLVCGQDGSYLYLAELNQSKLKLKEYSLEDPVFGAFNPNGSEFVSVTGDNSKLNVISFPEGKVLASLDSEAVFGGYDFSECPDEFGYEVFFLDKEHIVVNTRFERMLLIRRKDLKVLATIFSLGYELKGYDERGNLTNDQDRIVDYGTGLGRVCSAGAGRVLAIYENNVVRLLDFSPILKKVVG